MFMQAHITHGLDTESNKSPGVTVNKQYALPLHESHLYILVIGIDFKKTEVGSLYVYILCF